jgi:hypothetical protein
MADISVHDNYVTGYSVSCENRRIVLHTEFREREPNERTDIVFSGIEAYFIFRDNMSTILYDVDERAISEILKEFSSEFESGEKYGWPGIWNKSTQACLEHFRKEECKGWIISSSIGMEGFVIAKDMKLLKI